MRKLKIVAWSEIQIPVSEGKQLCNVVIFFLLFYFLLGTYLLYTYCPLFEYLTMFSDETAVCTLRLRIFVYL